MRFRSESHAKSIKQADTLQIEGRGIPLKIEEVEASHLLPGLRLARVNPAETLAAVKALAARPDVLYAEPNYARERFAAPNDPLYANLWGLTNTGTIFGNPGSFLPGFDIDAEEAWNITTGSRDVVVGIVDGGIDPNHNDLQPNMWVNPAEIPGNGQDDDGNGAVDDINGFDFFHNQGSFFDSGDLESESHATHVAGIVGAVGNNGAGVVGVNWQVSLMSLKVFGRKNESPFPSSVRMLVRAYTYAKVMRDLWTSSGGTRGANIRVLNNSLGGYGRSQTEFDAVRALNDSGVLFVAAAGNDTRNNDVFPVYPAGYELPNVISVAASTQFFDGLSSFTNVGARTVTMSAPGQTIQSTTAFGNYEVFNGTSMASPYVAGAAALICAAHPNIAVDKLRAALIYNGDRVSSQDYKTLTGRRLNAFKSLNAAAENDVTAPAPITDFRIIAREGRRITLGWTATGDDGNLGTVSLYDIRFSASDLSSTSQFEAATSISPLAIPIPSSAGTLESAVVEVPFGHTSGQIGLRATDNIGHTSPIATVSVSLDQNVPGLYDVTESQPEPLSTGGTQVVNFGPAYPDDGFSEYALPFAFPYFGTWVSTVTVSPNGALYFSTPPKFLLPPMTGNAAPLDAFSSIRALQTNAMIAGMWDDLLMRAGVFAVKPDTDRVIFRWEGVTFDTKFDDGASRGEHPIKFEIELRKNGTIQFRYGDGNQKLFPVVGISGGAPDAYVINSHTSEDAFKDLTNANTVSFVRRFPLGPATADLQISLNPPALLMPPETGGNSVSLPQAAVPGQNIGISATVTDLGPDAADNVVITAQLPAGLSFVGCSPNLTCTGPPAGSNGGTVIVNAGTVGQSFFKNAAASAFTVHVNAAAGATLNTTFSVTSSSTDLNPTNNTVVQTILVADYSLFNRVVAVAGNNDNTIALDQDGIVWTWGLAFGESPCVGCGDALPKRVLPLTDVVAIASHNGHSLALKSDGTVWSWGFNDLGQLGSQPLYDNPFFAFPPTQIPGLTNIKSIATGLTCSFALAADGSVWAWGDNAKGQLGDGTTTRRATPVHLTTINNVRSISTNGDVTYAIKEDGSVWAWGNNISLLLGTGSSNPSFSAIPLQVNTLTGVQTVVLGGFYVLALKNDGTVVGFGDNFQGQLGNGTTDKSAVPVAVSGLSGVTQIAAGAIGSMALKSDGTVWAWGEDQLTPKRVDLPSAKGVATWATTKAVILSDNTLQMWGGFNIFGSLGDGTLAARNVPGPVNTLKVVTAPTVTPGGRVYVFPTDVKIDCETFGAVLHYTTTGAEPTENDPVISAGNTIRIDRTMVLKVKAWKPGWNASQTVSGGYTILASGPPPFIFVEEGNTSVVAALDSVTLTRGPFRILSDDNLSPDHHTRLIFFTSNLGLNQSDLGLISVQAAGLPLAVENVGKVTGVPGLDASFVIVRLPDGLPAGELPLTITVRGLLSRNSPTLVISP